jgi:hypothetical protein
MFMGLPDPFSDPLFTSTDQAPAPALELFIRIRMFRASQIR